MPNIVHAIDRPICSTGSVAPRCRFSHVLREVERACSKRHTIVSFRIDLAPCRRVAYFLNTSQWLDASDTGVDRALPRLVDAVKEAKRTHGHSPVSQANSWPARPFLT